MRAYVEMHLGEIYVEKLTFLVANFVNNEEAILEVVNHKVFEFPELIGHLNFPSMKDIKNPEDAVKI